MIRLLLRTTFSDTYANSSGTEYTSYDMHEPDLERKLTSGGYGEGGHNRTELIGAEIVSDMDNETWIKVVAQEANTRGITNLNIQQNAKSPSVGANEKANDN